jgi:hypothetical protein
MKITKVFLPLIALVFSTGLFAKPNEISEKKIQDYFEILSYDKVDFEPDGAVCERVAVREVDKLYPKENFNIINSIQYDDKKTTIGELDIVVFEKSSGNVEAIAEVKCWKNFQGALKKAKAQRMRFQTYLNRNIVLTDTDDNKYSKESFKNVKKYFTISQEGGLNEGFDFELSLDLKELMELRKRLLDCNVQGKCPRK